MSLVDRKTVEEKFAVELRDLKRLKEDMDAEIQKENRELIQKAVAEIGAVVRKIGEKDGYTVILEKSSGAVSFNKDSVDITDKIISAYDEKK